LIFLEGSYGTFYWLILVGSKKICPTPFPISFVGGGFDVVFL